jgi:cytochrome oxidase Cu insertion factor (SCO1/SenC/PrrC family)
MRVALLLALASSACAPAWRAQLEAWTPSQPLPAFPLVDANSEPLSLRDEPTLLAFAFSRCAVPTACPQTIERVRAIEGRVRTVIITLDPAHDTPTVLSSWAARTALSRTTFATGEPEVIDALTSCFNVFTTRDMAHPVKAALLIEGRIARVFNDNNFGPDDFEGIGHRAPGTGHRG